MAPKKKSGASAHPSTSKALPLIATNDTGDAEAREDVDAIGDVVRAGSTITTYPVAKAGAGDTVGEEQQKHPDDHAPRGTGEGVTSSTPLPGIAAAMMLGPGRIAALQPPPSQ